MPKRTGLSFRDALDLVPDDMPDGAAFALAHEMAGLEYGDGFDELLPKRDPVFNVGKAIRKKIEKFGTLQNNDAYHWQVRRDGRVVADWWPHKNKWRIDGKITHGTPTAFVNALTRHMTV